MKIDKDTTVLGILEFSSIAVGFKALDEMVKTAPIKIIDARTICFGKYLIVFSGDVASVEYSFKKGVEIGKKQLLDSLFLPMIHPEIIGAIGNIQEPEDWGTIGILETKTVTSAVEAADIAAKTGGVQIVEIRLANGYGGKSYVKMMGNLDDVQAAAEAGTAKLISKKQLFEKIIIPQPEKEIKTYFLK